MVNEMGNQNASEIKEEENEASDAIENVQEPSLVENDIKEENNIKPESSEGKEFHEKDDDLCNHDKPEAANDSEFKLPMSNEKDEDEKEVKPVAQFPEVVLKEDEQEFIEEKIGKNDTEIHINKSFIERELISEAHEPTEVPIEEGDDDLSSLENKETEEIIALKNCKESTENPQVQSVDVISTDHYKEEEDKSVIISNSEEKFDSTSCEDKVDNNGTVKLHDSSDSKLKDLPQPNDNSMILTDKIMSNAQELENFEYKLPDLVSNEEAVYSSSTDESFQIETKEAKVTNNFNQSGVVDNEETPIEISIIQVSCEKEKPDQESLLESKIEEKSSEMEIQESKREFEHDTDSTPWIIEEVELPITQDNVGRHSIESNPEKTCERIELRKCPSFDFGTSVNARPGESDQTPLLRHDKNVFRSLSSCSNVTFHSANGRSSLDYDQMVAEEKIIRMERSDSDNYSRPPFFSLNKKEDSINTPHVHENNVVSSRFVNESESTPAIELERSSPRGNVKRKNKSSFFSTCLCCTAAIN